MFQKQDLIDTERERERERESEQIGFRAKNFPKRKKPPSKLWLGIILGTIVLAGAGTTIYLVTRSKNTETEKQVQQKIQQLTKQLSQIENHLTTLNQNITKTETSLNTKKIEQTQNPSNPLQTEINQLEQQLTTYKSQKTKLETVLPKLKQQISNLQKVNADKLSTEQEQTLSQLNQEIKQLNQDLGIPEAPEKKPNNPDPQKPDFPNSTLQDLSNDLKIVHDYLTENISQTESNPPNPSYGNYQAARQKWQTHLDQYKSELQEVKQLQDKFTASVSPQQEEIIKTRAELRKKWKWAFKDNPLPDEPIPNPNDPNQDQTNREYTYQKLQKKAETLDETIKKINQKYEDVKTWWRTLDSQTQDIANAFCGGKLKNFYAGLNPIEQIGSGIYSNDSYSYFLTLNEGQQKELTRTNESKVNVALSLTVKSLNYVLDFGKETIKIGEEMIRNLRESGIDSTQAELELEKEKTILATAESKLKNPDVKSVEEAWLAMEKLKWGNQGN